MSYADFSKLCHVIKYFTGLNQNFGKEYIDFPLSSSSRDIEWLNKHIIELGSYVDQIYTSLYHDLNSNKISFKDPFIFKLVNSTRDTCN